MNRSLPHVSQRQMLPGSTRVQKERVPGAAPPCPTRPKSSSLYPLPLGLYLKPTKSFPLFFQFLLEMHGNLCLSLDHLLYLSVIHMSDPAQRATRVNTSLRGHPGTPCPRQPLSCNRPRFSVSQCPAAMMMLGDPPPRWTGARMKSSQGAAWTKDLARISTVDGPGQGASRVSGSGSPGWDVHGRTGHSAPLARPLPRRWEPTVRWPAHGCRQPFCSPATSCGASPPSGQARATLSPSWWVDSSSCKITPLGRFGNQVRIWARRPCRHVP